MEVGCGSGYVLTSVALLLQHAGVTSVLSATDLNPDAIACTRKTLLNHGFTNEAASLVLADLVNPLRPRLDGLLDLLLFNPPYVVTPEEEVGRPGLCSAWAGGKDGRVVIDRFLPQVPSLLRPGGRMYMVAIQENRPPELIAWGRKLGLLCDVVLVRGADEEKLHILRYIRPKPS